MGVIYSIACKTCKTYRDLDKLDPWEADNREEALEYARHIEETTAYRPAILIAFMAAHLGHDCTLIDDYHSKFDDFLEGYEEEKGFWDEDEEE